MNGDALEDPRLQVETLGYFGRAGFCLELTEESRAILQCVRASPLGTGEVCELT